MPETNGKVDNPNDPVSSTANANPAPASIPASYVPAVPLVEGKHEFPKIISFDSLARCGEEIWIENSGQVYRLRRTRQGKLILTK